MIGLVSLFVTIVISLVSLLIVLGAGALLFLFRVFLVFLDIIAQLIIWICLTAVDFVRYMSENPPYVKSPRTNPAPPSSPEITPRPAPSPEIPMLSVVKIHKHRPSKLTQE
jgi:hypothetical protein